MFKVKTTTFVEEVWPDQKKTLVYFPNQKMIIYDRKQYMNLMEKGKIIDLEDEIEEKEVIFTQNSVKLKDLNYFSTLKKDKRFLIESFLYPGTVNMLFSPPAQFKSLLANYIAIAITTGKNFLGLKSKRFPVIYCDKENNEQILKDRLACLSKGHGLKRKQIDLWFVTQNGDILNPIFLRELKTHIKERGVKLVIFDTLHRFADYEENKADDINRLYTRVFKPLVSELDCSVLFLHHTTKDGGYRGSSDLFGMIDVAYSLKRNGKKDEFKLICEKSRFGEIDTLYGSIDFSEKYIKFNKTDAKDVREDSINILQMATEKIKEMFPLVGSKLLRKDIITNFEMMEDFNPSPATVKRSLAWLVHNDKLKTDKKGEYVRLD